MLQGQVLPPGDVRQILKGRLPPADAAALRPLEAHRAPGGVHLALGRGLNSSPAGNPDLFNDSTIHIDFMIGTPDMKIVGTTEDGQEVEIFRDGDFAL